MMDAGWMTVVKDQGKVISYALYSATLIVLIVYGAGREMEVKRWRQKADDREEYKKVNHSHYRPGQAHRVPGS